MVELLPELVKQLKAYATRSLSIDRVDITISGAPGSKWNPGDTGRISVQVRNDGPIPLSNLRLRLRGSDFGGVSLSPGGPFVDTVLAEDDYKVDATKSARFGPFHFKASAPTPANANADVVEVVVEGFDLDWDLLMRGIDASEAPGGAGSITIYPI